MYKGSNSNIPLPILHRIGSLCALNRKSINITKSLYDSDVCIIRDVTLFHCTYKELACWYKTSYTGSMGLKSEEFGGQFNTTIYSSCS